MTPIEFDSYHAKHPEIYEHFKRFAFQAINSGRKYFSSRTIIERMRWYTAVEAQGERFKISDHISPFYSRMFESDHPEYEGFFRKKGSQSDYYQTCKQKELFK